MSGIVECGRHESATTKLQYDPENDLYQHHQSSENRINQWTGDASSLSTSKGAQKNSAVISRCRLMSMGYWNQKPYGHGSVLGLHPGGIPHRELYYMPRNNIFGTRYTLHIPDSKSWNYSSFLTKNGTHFFTDGSKLDGGVGIGIYSVGLHIRINNRLLSGYNVFQAEIIAIKTASEVLI